MTFSELRQEVRKNIGRTDVNDTATATMIDNAINHMLVEFLPMEGLRPYKNNNTFSTVANQEYIDMSTLTGFVGIVYNGVGAESGDNWDVMYPMTQEDYDNRDTGKPTKYEVRYISNSPYLYLRPIPDAVYKIKVWYYAREVKLVDDTDEAIISKTYGDRVVIAGATMLVSKQLGIERLSALWEREFYKIELPRLLNWQASRLEGDLKDYYNLYL